MKRSCTSMLRQVAEKIDVELLAVKKNYGMMWNFEYT